MTARSLKTRDVPKSQYVVYFDRAKDFYASMLEAREAGRWSTVGLTAVHCAIALCDALMVYYQGQRSVGEDHLNAVELVSRVPVRGIDSQAANLRRIIAKKNAVAYEDREFRQGEAADICRQAERFFLWASGHLPAV